MPTKSNHDFRGKYPCARSGTLVPMRIKDIFTKNSCFWSYASVLTYKKAHNDIKLDRDVKMIKVVDTSQHFLRKDIQTQ